MGILTNELLHVSVYLKINKSQLTTYDSTAVIHKAIPTGLVWSVKHISPHAFVIITATGTRLPPHQACEFCLPISYIPLMLPVTPYCLEDPFSPSSNLHSPQGPFLTFTTHCRLRDQQTRAHTRQIKLYWTTAMLH